ncbi:MAG: monofunctional biosynthetic peptidoglycan transglycosylase [Hyphomicrobium sp.]
MHAIVPTPGDDLSPAPEADADGRAVCDTEPGDTETGPAAVPPACDPVPVTDFEAGTAAGEPLEPPAGAGDTFEIAAEDPAATAVEPIAADPLSDPDETTAPREWEAAKAEVEEAFDPGSDVRNESDPENPPDLQTVPPVEPATILAAGSGGEPELPSPLPDLQRDIAPEYPFVAFSEPSENIAVGEAIEAPQRVDAAPSSGPDGETLPPTEGPLALVHTAVVETIAPAPVGISEVGTAAAEPSTVASLPVPAPPPELDWLVARIAEAAEAHEGRVAPGFEPPHEQAASSPPEPPSASVTARHGADPLTIDVITVPGPPLVAEVHPEPTRFHAAPMPADLSPLSPIDLRVIEAVGPSPTAASYHVADASPVDAPQTIDDSGIGDGFDWRHAARRTLRVAAYAVGGYVALILVLMVAYRFVNPPASTLMVYEGLFGAGARQTWVPLEKISPHLVRAVVVAEDGRFCDHHGIDFAAMEEALEKAADGIPRGASTISMQVTKNLFLWHSKSYVRKLFELPMTLIMELLWPKSRILEIYLNIAEWGPGVFGAEAAAQHHFNRPASSLTERESAQLAATLPNPIRRDAGDPGPQVQRKASIIQNRARAAGEAAPCVKVRRSTAS